MRTDFYGSAGASARVLARSWSVRRALTIAVASVAVPGLVLTGQPLAALAGLTFAWLVTRHAGGRIRRARAGAGAESATSTHFRFVRVEAVMFDLPVAPGDIDVVVLGPVAAAVEVKRASGKVRIRRDGSMAVGGRPIPGHPGRQAIAGASRLSTQLGNGVWVDPVVCLTGMAGRPRVTEICGQSVVVCAPRHLSRVLKRLPRRLERGDGRMLAAQLARNSDTSLRARGRV